MRRGSILVYFSLFRFLSIFSQHHFQQGFLSDRACEFINVVDDFLPTFYISNYLTPFVSISKAFAVFVCHTLLVQYYKLWTGTLHP